tara:strand:- start:2557 stop:3255 length:699 start_codon:yes stop_codon:yes gene_type:complete
MVAQQIRWHTHADIGSDHGHLLKALLKSGRIEHGIAIENKSLPWENSRRTLAGLSADVRLADGMAGLAEGEADGLSVCGMGGAAIARILEKQPERLPGTIIVQPNCKARLVRRWAIQRRFALVDESMALGSAKRVRAAALGTRRRFVVLRFQRSETSSRQQHAYLDEAYGGLDQEAALLFGPRLIRAWDREFVASLYEEQAHLRSLARRGPETAQRLAALERLLATRPPESN